jgi:ubiquinone/menaquinone biosynthesis C-methylase UbiE
MNNSLEVKKHWNKIGDDYQNFWHTKAQKIMSQWETNFVKEWVDKKHPINILDLGVGNGRILEALSEKSNEESSIYGLDISSKMVEYCKNKFLKNTKIKEIKVLNCNENVNAFDKKFDLITSIRVIKYNESWEKMLKQLFGFLNKGGRIVFSMPNKNAITRFLKTDITYIKVSPSYIEKIAYENNMEILEIKGFSRIPDLFYNIDNRFVSKLIIFSEKILMFIFGKYFLCREVFYVFSKK